MTRKTKLILLVSLGLNVVLIAITIWGMMKLNFVKEQVIINQVQEHLVELEGLIAHQSRHQWSDPNLVTTKLGDVLNGILQSIRTGELLGVLSQSEKQILTALYSKFRLYPHDELYKFVDLSEEDKHDYELLRQTLREAEFGLRIAMNDSMDSFMKKAKILEQTILMPSRAR
ncbi:hypothetical protein [Paenibacillus lemnae]|uniref:Uncharacterized protein n=1 Tax=Paenibacillus lemnae TaxID=1330551 RepID=A0A848MBY3_PAELE|nr:hypothetical protein [Paenibacillus lemnae]NMO97691.1 hypothetical protein [Paenibacillus lemnae]